jgi:hypothetical protein
LLAQIQLTRNYRKVYSGGFGDYRFLLLSTKKIMTCGEVI